MFQEATWSSELRGDWFERTGQIILIIKEPISSSLGFTGLQNVPIESTMCNCTQQQKKLLRTAAVIEDSYHHRRLAEILNTTGDAICKHYV